MLPPCRGWRGFHFIICWCSRWCFVQIFVLGSFVRRRLYFQEVGPVGLLFKLLFSMLRCIPLAILMDFCCPVIWFPPVSLSRVVHLCCAPNGFVSSVAQLPVLCCFRYGAGYWFGLFSKRHPAWIHFPCVWWVVLPSLRRSQVFSFPDGVPFVFRYCSFMPGFLLSGDCSSCTLFVGLLYQWSFPSFLFGVPSEMLSIFYRRYCPLVVIRCYLCTNISSWLVRCLYLGWYKFEGGPMLVYYALSSWWGSSFGFFLRVHHYWSYQ